jgi:protocatechuate 3,4-dioxygenase beta subunit
VARSRTPLLLLVTALAALAGAVWLLEDGGPTQEAAAPLVTAPRAEAPDMELPVAIEPEAMVALEPEPPPAVPEPGQAGLPKVVLHSGASLRRELNDSIRVLVLSPGHGTVTGAELHVWEGEDPVQVGVPAHTDGEGYAQVTLPHDQAFVSAWHPEAGTSPLLSLQALFANTSSEGDPIIWLGTPARLDVDVQLHGGAPASGVSVVVTSALQNMRLPPGPPRVTDGLGRASFEVVTGFPVVAYAEDVNGRSDLRMVQLEPGEVGRVQLQLPGPWSIRGIVLDERGEPAPGLEVTLWRALEGGDLDAGVLPGGEPYRDEEGTDSEGAFRFNLPGGGDYLVQVTDEGRSPSDVMPASVDDYSPVANVMLRAFPAASISGRLVDGDGAPLAGATVHARPAHHYDFAMQAYGPTLFTRMGQGRDRTDEEGAFVLSGLNPIGTFIVWCRPDEEQRDRKLVLTDIPAGTEDLLLVASEEALARGVLESVVLQEGSRVPLDEIRATLVINLDGRVLDTKRPVEEGAEGLLRIEGLAPGFDYALRLDAPGCGAVELPWFTARRGVQRMDATLPPEGELMVVVRDRDGRALPGVDVWLDLQSEFPVKDGLRAATTDATGAAHLSRLDPGTWILGAQRVEPREVVVHQGATDTVELVFGDG